MFGQMIPILAVAALAAVATPAGASPVGAGQVQVRAGAASAGCEHPDRALAGTTRAASLRSYDDFIEDAGAAPDFCASNIVTNDNESVTIAIHVHNRNGFSTGDQYGAFLDTDSNPATGGSGAEYLILFDGGGVRLGHWNGTTFDSSTPQASLALDWINGLGPVLQISRADLGNPTAFEFVLASLNGEDGDVAPDTGTWSYQLTPLELTVVSLTNGIAKAGKPFVARMLVTRSDFESELTEGTIGCAATVGGKPLAGAGAFADDRAVCTWRLPKNVRGKRLTGSVTVTFQGVRAQRSFAVTVH